MSDGTDGAEGRVDKVLDAFSAQYREVYRVMLPASAASGPEREAYGFPSFSSHADADLSRKAAESAGRLPPGCWVKGSLVRVVTDA